MAGSPAFTEGMVLARGQRPEAPEEPTAPPPPALRPQVQRVADGFLGSSAINGLIGTATQDVFGPAQKRTQETVDTMKDIYARREKEMGPLRDKSVSDAERRRELALKSYQGIEPVDVQPWTREVPKNDPIREFGSAASVFAQLATAFTGASIDNALNAGAAAMMAIQRNDANEYDKSFRAWQSNTELALNRHAMQHKDFQAAMNMLAVDAAAGEAQMKAVAAKYGDEQALALTVAGEYGKLNDLARGRQGAAIQLLQIAPNLEKMGLRQQILMADPDYSSGDPQRIAAAVRRAEEAVEPRYGAGGFQRNLLASVQAELTTRLGREPTTAELMEEYNKVSTAGKPQGIEKQVYDDTKTELEKELGREASVAEVTERINLNKQRGKTLTPNQLLGQEIELGVKELESKLGRPATAEERAQVRRTAEVTGMSGNKRDDLMATVDLYDQNLDTIDRALTTLDKYVGAAGASGAALRMAEKVDNLLGNNETDRAQFKRDIAYLQMVGTRLLTGSGSRPLAMEERRINDIIGGLKLLDTTADTKRSLDEIRALYMNMRKKTLDRVEGNWQPGGNVPPQAPGQSRQSAPAPWQSAPLVK